MVFPNSHIFVFNSLWKIALRVLKDECAQHINSIVTKSIVLTPQWFTNKWSASGVHTHTSRQFMSSSRIKTPKKSKIILRQSAIIAILKKRYFVLLAIKIAGCFVHFVRILLIMLSCYFNDSSVFGVHEDRYSMMVNSMIVKVCCPGGNAGERSYYLHCALGICRLQIHFEPLS